MSAVSASPAVRGRSPLDPVRALQHALYRAAKADPGRRFHALWDKVLRRDVLWRAWVAVRRNNGAPGIDKTTLAEVEGYGGCPVPWRVGRGFEGWQLSAVAGASGVDPEAGAAGGVSPVVDSFCSGPGCAGCAEGGTRTHFRGGLCATRR